MVEKFDDRVERVRLTSLATHIKVKVLVDEPGVWATVADTDSDGALDDNLLNVQLGVRPPEVLGGEFPFEEKFHDIDRDEDGRLEEVHSFERVHATVESNALVVRHYHDEIGPEGEELVAVVEASVGGVEVLEPPYTSLRQRDLQTPAGEGVGEQGCRDTTIIDDYERRIACPFCGGEVNISQVDSDGVVECGEYLPNDMGCGRRLQICVREVDRDDSQTPAGDGGHE
jgi:hypothetical protein